MAEVWAVAECGQITSHCCVPTTLTYLLTHRRQLPKHKQLKRVYSLKQEELLKHDFFIKHEQFLGSVNIQAQAWSILVNTQLRNGQYPGPGPVDTHARGSSIPRLRARQYLSSGLVDTQAQGSSIPWPRVRQYPGSGLVNTQTQGTSIPKLRARQYRGSRLANTQPPVEDLSGGKQLPPLPWRSGRLIHSWSPARV